jgi:hypothetical protein
MNSTLEVLNIANQLDAIGLYTEADILDRFLQKRAQELMYREKPFFAQLAEIILSVKNSEETIKEKLSLPLSDKSITGLSKKEALEEVIDHAEVYIDSFMKLRLEKMVDTSYEENYRHFAGLALNAVSTLKDILTSGHKTGTRETIRQIQHTQTMINRLSFYGRDKAQNPKDLEDLQKIQSQAYSLLEMLKNAVQIGDLPRVKEISAQLEQIFPMQPDTQSMLYKAIGTAATDVLSSEDQRSINQKIFDQLQEGEETWEESLHAEILESNIKDLKGKLEKLRVDESNTSALSDEFKELVTQIKEHQKMLKRPSPLTDEGKELARSERETSKISPTYQFKSHQQKSRTRIYNLTREEVRILHEWFQDYLNSDAAVKGTTFAIYLGRKPSDLNELFSTIDRNIDSIRRSLEYDINHIGDRLKQSQGDLGTYKIQIEEIRNEYLWKVWRDRFLKKMLDVVQVSLQPQEGEKQEMLFDTALSRLRQLLDYGL